MTTKARVKAMMECIDAGCDIEKRKFNYNDLAHLTLSYAINEVRKGNTRWCDLYDEINYQAECLAEEAGMESHIIKSSALFLFKHYCTEYKLCAYNFTK